MRPPRTYWTVLLLLTLALAIAAASSLAQTDPPASGDWTVSDATLVENRTVDLRGDLIVRSGGELDLRNVTLRVHSTVTVVHGITVEAGGRLVVEDADGSASTEGDRSFIVRGAPSFGFSFVVEQGASLRINRSVVQGAGQVGGSRGVLVRANDTVLRSATFLDGHEYGLRVEATSGLSVRNCIFSRSHDGLVLRDVRNASVVNSVCSDNDRDGILLYNVTDSIIDHTAAQDNSLRGMEVTNCRNVTLSNLFVASNPWGLVLTRVKDLRVEASTVNDTSFSAVILEGPSSDVELTNCTIHSSQRTCVEGSDVLNLTLRGCWLENATYHGIHFLEDMDGLLIERCTIVRNGYDGVSIAKAEGVTVTDCAISDNGYNGVNMIECEDVVISGNILESNNYEGINCDHVTGLFLGNITVRLSRLYNGIKLQADTNNVTIVSCTLANNSRSGINLDAAHNVTVVDCNVSGNALSGVKVEAGSYDIWLENNTHWMNAMEGLLVEASWNVTMEGGAVDAPAGPLVNAIYVSRGGVVWLLNVTLNGGVRVSSAGNTTVVDEQLGSYTRRVSADSQLDEAVWTTVHVLWPDLTPVRSARVFANSSDGERSAFALTDVYGTVEHLPVTVQSWNGTEAIDRNPVTFRAEKGEEATSEQRTLLARTVVTIILLDDRPPIARALDVDAELGFEATFDGTASYDNGDIASWEWTFDDGIGVVQLQGAMATWTFLRLGTFAGTLNVTDSVGLWNETALNITVVDTTVPSVDLGDLISVDQHTTVDLDARGTEDNDPLLLTTGTFSWTIYRVGQEGEPIATLDGPLETWTFDDIGSYLVVLDVTDQSGNSANGSLRLAVLDIDPPIVELGPDRLVGQGTAVVLGFEVLEDNDPNFTLNMKVTWSISGPGLELNLTGPMPEFTPEEMGEYTVTVTVEDPSGNSAGDKIKVTARDTHPPQVTVGPDLEVRMGNEVSLSGSATDNDPAFPEGATWWWDIEGPDVDLRLRGPNAIFTPPWIGEYIATLTVTDDAGNEAHTSLTVSSGDVSYPTFGAFTPDEDETQDHGHVTVTIVLVDEQTGIDSGSVQVRSMEVTGGSWTPWSVVPLTMGGLEVLVSVDLDLQEGRTLVEFTCADMAGNEVHSMAYSVVVNSRPVLVLLSPADGADYGPVDDILLDASGSYDPDPSDELTVTWTSDIDGTLGEGPARSAQLSPGDHVITVRVTDGIVGHEVFGTVNVTVRPVPSTVSGDGNLPWGIWLLVLVLVIVVLAVLELYARDVKKRARESAGGDEGPAELETDEPPSEGSKDREETPEDEVGGLTNQ